MRNFAQKRMRIRIPPPVFVPMPVPAIRARYKAQGMLWKGIENVLDALLAIAPYFMNADGSPVTMSTDFSEIMTSGGRISSHQW